MRPKIDPKNGHSEEDMPAIALCNLVDVFGWNYDDTLETGLAGEDDDFYVDDDEDDDINEIFEALGKV